MKQVSIIFLIFAIFALSTPIFAEDEYNYELANGWRYDNAVSKKVVSIFTSFEGKKNEITDEPLDVWTSTLIAAAEISLLSSDEDLNLSIFGEWGVVYQATGADNFEGFDDALLGLKFQFMKSKYLTASVFAKGILTIGKDELSLNDYIPLGLGLSASTCLISSNFFSFGGDFILDFQGILAKKDTDPDFYDFHGSIEGWMLLGESTLAIRFGLEFDFLSVENAPDDNSYYLYIEAQLGMGLFARVGVPIDLSSGSFINRIKEAYETGDMTFSLGFSFFIK